MTFAALDPSDIFTTEELTNATRNLPPAGLHSAAEALSRALEGAQAQRGEYWHNRLLPYLQNIWPKSRDLITPEISESLARLCVVAGEVFPDALKELQYWLQPLQHANFIVHLLHKEKLCEQFPSDALMFLDAVVGNDIQWFSKKLRQCLDDIEQANQHLVNDARFIRLAELVARSGLE